MALYLGHAWNYSSQFNFGIAGLVNTIGTVTLLFYSPIYCLDSVILKLLPAKHIGNPRHGCIDSTTENFTFQQVLYGIRYHHVTTALKPHPNPFCLGSKSLIVGMISRKSLIRTYGVTFFSIQHQALQLHLQIDTAFILLPFVKKAVNYPFKKRKNSLGFLPKPRRRIP